MSNCAVMKTAGEAIRNKASVSSSYTSGSNRDKLTGNEGGRHHVSSPLVGRVYHARMVGMRKCISAALSSCEHGVMDGRNDRQLLVLGCGHDRSYSSYNVRAYMVDFEDIIKVRREEEARAGMSQSGEQSGEQFVGADLRHPENVLAQLRALTAFDSLVPTVSSVSRQPSCVLFFFIVIC